MQHTTFTHVGGSSSSGEPYFDPVLRAGLLPLAVPLLLFDAEAVPLVLIRG